ncbi:MAG TPA: NUDIX hydrolase [bacterium]|nr:NUDIX hydrolase [bacterium]
MTQFTFSKKDPNSFPFNTTVVSALLERKNDRGEIELLLQKRINSNDSVYYGTLEIPAGHILKFENIYDALNREVSEESGYTISEIINDEKTDIFSTLEDDGAFAFKPFICQQYIKGRGWGWMGFVFRCLVEKGETKEIDNEAADHHWVTLVELKNMLTENPKQFFTFHLPVLHYYINFHEKNIEQK